MKASDTWSEARQARSIIFGLVFIALIALVWVMAAMLPDRIDWRPTYRPAALALLSFHSPYAPEVAREAPFAAAAWGLLPLIPLALLPLKFRRAILLLASLIFFAFSAKKLGANRVGVALFLLSPPVIHCLLNGNIDWIPILGFVLPLQIGLFLITVKPQIGFAVAIYWLFQTWREGGIEPVVKTFLPVSMTLLASFGLFGLWPFQTTRVLTIAQDYNASLWPISIPIGLVLIVLAIRLKQAKWAMAASVSHLMYFSIPGTARWSHSPAELWSKLRQWWDCGRRSSCLRLILALPVSQPSLACIVASLPGSLDRSASRQQGRQSRRVNHLVGDDQMVGGRL
jgi:hypothetical protein